MKCDLNPNIKSISGRVGGMLFKTFKRPDGSTQTRAYFLPKKENGKFGYERKKAASKNEIASRAKFAKVSAVLNSLSEESKLRFHKEWVAAKYMFNGKKYVSFRGYIMARLYAEIDNLDI